MVAFIGLLSLFGFFACIVMTIVNAIRKKPVKPVAIGIAICFVVFVICLAVTPPVENNQQVYNMETTNSEQIIASTEEETTSNAVESETISVEDSSQIEESSQQENNNAKEPNESKESTVVEESSQNVEITDTRDYDKLQNLFLAFNFETTEDALLKWIEDNVLEYTAKKYNGTPKEMHYKIAYEHDVALQKYAESGDHIKISFNIEDGSFMYAEYFNSNTTNTAILYNYGTYWDFREKEGNNKYSGYYYYTSWDDRDGIIIEYSNGNSTETGYHSVENGVDALSSVLD